MGSEKRGAEYRYKARNIKRIPLDVQKGFYDQIRAKADQLGIPINTFVKRAILNELRSLDDSLNHI